MKDNRTRVVQQQLILVFLGMGTDFCKLLLYFMQNLLSNKQPDKQKEKVRKVCRNTILSIQRQDSSLSNIVDSKWITWSGLVDIISGLWP